MVLERVCCPDCGSEDVVKNGNSNEGVSALFVPRSRLASSQLRPGLLKREAICLP